jgi:light-regulated signal transduction histidine kinase (bacteriophytochrome)
MKAQNEQIRAAYLSMVISFLSKANEEDLHRGYELGRDALDSRLGILEVADAYVVALSEILKFSSPESARTVEATRELLSTSLAPFEMTQRGYQDSISKLKEMNQELEQQAQDLKTANQELEAFSYTVSHDVRSPISGIGSLAEIMLEEYQKQIDENGRLYLTEIAAAARKTLELVEGLLSLAQFSRQELVRTDVDLSQMAHSIVRDLQQNDLYQQNQETEKAPRHVIFSIAENVIVQGDQKLLFAVMNNLLGNAWKYTSREEHAKIEFGVSMKDRKPIYFVKDNGAGFDMRSAGKLFSPFQRLHSASQFQGTGVGLATVRRIIERHGGQIWAESQVGQGATFYFTL